jgi:hypothetical protein
VIGVELVSLPPDEGPINVFQSRVAFLVAPSEEATTQMHFLQASMVEEALELSHQPGD